MAVHFIDTSVLCNLIPVPGRTKGARRQDVHLWTLDQGLAARA